MSKIIASLVCLMFVTSMVLAQEAAAPAAAPEAAPAAAPAVAPAATPAAAPAAAAPAADVKAPAMMPLELRKTGIVNVTKDASGKVSAIKLIVTSYDIQLDDGSKALEAMDGQKVRVTCTLSHEGGKRILTVKNVETVAEGGAMPAMPAAVPAAAPAVAPAAAPAAAPAEKPAEAPAAK
jgi:pyruvate dehydrogenase E2 component (dihydrolipoamide acetyltransferase)